MATVLDKLFQDHPQVMLAEFDSPYALLHAAEKIRAAGYKKFDCHSPFPIHGMDKAMGLGRSPLGYIVGASALVGMAGILALTYWTSAVDYPLVISGKPFFSWQAFIPVIFAVTILTSAFGAFLGMLSLNKLPRLFHPVFNSERFVGATDDRFFVSIESNDPLYNADKTRSFLASLGGSHIEVVQG